MEIEFRGRRYVPASELEALREEQTRHRPLVEAALAYARLLDEPDTYEASEAEEQAQHRLLTAAAVLRGSR